MYHWGASWRNDGSGGFAKIPTTMFRNITARNVCINATIALRERSFPGMCSAPVLIAPQRALRSRSTRAAREAAVAATIAAVHA